MSHRFNRRGLGSVAAACLFVAHTAGATALYDPSLNSLPSAQGWFTFGTPGYAQSVGGGVYTLDTRAANGVQVGSSMFNVPALDTVTGFKLDFNLRVISEAHANENRAGFSVIVTGADPTHALELGFWDDRVFAYTAAFARGSEALSATTTATDYSLIISNNQYTFSGNGSALLSGSLVDYTANGAPYNQHGFLFFGDDTTSAQSLTAMGSVTLAAVPEPTTAALLVAGLVGLVFVRRHTGNTD